MWYFWWIFKFTILPNVLSRGCGKCFDALFERIGNFFSRNILYFFFLCSLRCFVAQDILLKISKWQTQNTRFTEAHRKYQTQILIKLVSKLVFLVMWNLSTSRISDFHMNKIADGLLYRNILHYYLLTCADLKFVLSWDNIP